LEHEALRELSAPYALDALDPADERAFEDHLATCAECRADVAAFQNTAGSLALLSAGPPPPTGLRERILDGARDERSNVIPFYKRWALPAAASLAAAASIAAIAFGLWANSLSSQLHDERQARADVRRLAGADGSLVVLPSGEGTLLVRDLETPPKGMTYEAWVIEGGTPHAAGLFDHGGRRVSVPLTRRVPVGAVVAVTLERAGGVQAPTSKPIFQSRPV